MNRFYSVEEMKNFLRTDKEKGSLNPIRFINVDTMEKWVDVKKILLSMSNIHVCLSSFCAESDTTPNMRRLLANIKATRESICISPLSEYLRVNPDKAKSTVEDILAKDYSGNMDGKLRIYIPMYRMKSVLQTINDLDPRREDCLSFLETGEDSDYSLTIIQKDIDIAMAGNEISGFRQYLQYWEQNPDKPLILHTVNAIHFEQNIFFDNVKVIVSSYDLLCNFYHLPSIYCKGDGKDDYWDQLAKVVCKEHSFEAACCSLLLINKFTVRLFDNWNKYSSFQKWLLWMWSRLSVKDGYLGICIKESVSEESFVDLLCNKIIVLYDAKEFKKLYIERKDLLLKMGIDLPETFWEAVGNLEIMQRLSILSDNTAREREMVFSSLKDIAEQSRLDAIETLRMVFPALANYICSPNTLEIEDFPRSFTDYFDLYRWYKAANILPESFIELVKNIAVQRGALVYTLKSRNLIINEEYDDDTAVIFVDGMGIEYAGYLYSALNSLCSEGFRVRMRAGYCNLPSTTAVNKDFLEDKRVVASFIDLDEMKHGRNQYPRTIEQELSFLNLLAEKVRDTFNLGVSRIIVSSDHGTSRMAVLVRKTPFDIKVSAEGHSIYKYGRYCDGVDASDIYETTIEFDNKLIFADYSRFEQKGAPVDEVHGGASLEEWLVPIAIIDRTDARKAKLVVNIIPPQNPIRLDALTGMATVQFLLKGYGGDDVSVRVHGKKISCRHVDGVYTFKCEPQKTESNINTAVYVGLEHIGVFKFDIKQSITKNKKFDI